MSSDDFPLLVWQWASFTEFSVPQLYAVLAAREAVFVVEQACPYRELDGLDAQALHLVAWSGAEVAAYLRLLGPGVKDESSLGRVLTARAFRGRGLARSLMMRGLAQAAQTYPGCGLRISAQTYLQGFYRSLGFVAVSAPYLEDGIAHIDMLRAPELGQLRQHGGD